MDYFTCAEDCYRGQCSGATALQSSNKVIDSMPCVYTAAELCLSTLSLGIR